MMADDFTVERAVNLTELNSWADIKQFQWQEINHGIQDNREEMDALKTLFYDPAPKDTVGFYNQIYKARDNQYIVLRLEVKIWPQGIGEEMAKTFTFNGHSYGSLSVRTVMLDKSRIVPGDYTLQLIYYDEETEKSDTSYIERMLVDKLYTFYTYNKGELREAYLRCDSIKRIKLKPEWWAKTHPTPPIWTRVSSPTTTRCGSTST